MKARNTLGEFEQLVLLAVLRTGDEAFGPQIASALQQSAGRRATRGALYSTLNRLETKGLLTWTAGAPGPDRGGHIKRLFKVSPEGLRALRSSRKALLTMWSGLEQKLDGGRR